MMALAPWWRERTLREQWLIGAMLLVLVVVIGWLAVLRPLAAAREAAAQRLAYAESALAEVQQMAADMPAARPQGDAVPLIELVGRHAAVAGLTIQPLESDGDGRVRVRIAAVKALVLLRWIADLTAGDAVIIDSVSINRNGDRSVAADILVRAR